MKFSWFTIGFCSATAIAMFTRGYIGFGLINVGFVIVSLWLEKKKEESQ